MKSINSAFSARFSQGTKLGVLSACALFAASAAHAQNTIYTTDFNTDAYTTTGGVSAPSAYVAGETLSDSPDTADSATQWKTNDESGTLTPTVGQSDGVNEITGYSNTGDNKAFLGGLYGNAIRPGSQNVYLYRNFAVGTTPVVGFNVDMAITHSTSPHAQSDTFGWSVQGPGGVDLFSLRFVPSTTQGAGTTVGGEVVGATVYNVQVFDASGAKLASTGFAVSTDALYHLGIGVDSANQSIQIDLNPSTSSAISVKTISDPALTLSSVDSIQRVAATWLIEDTTTAANGGKTNAGTNTLIFDNYTVTTIPEPSTWAMLGLGITGLVLHFRRKARA